MAGSSLLGQRTAHVCVDMQQMFARDTDWHCPWLAGVLPAVAAIAEAHSARTIFTRFVPPEHPAAAPGAWQAYYDRWRAMTRDRLPAEMLELVPALARLVPPARCLDKAVYSPWSKPALHNLLAAADIDTLVVTGGETDVCVLAAVLGAIDLGYRVVLPTDAVFGSADETHDAMLGIYRSRFGQQLTTCTAQDVLDEWGEMA
jgi:nicotinamidase-related amidase